MDRTDGGACGHPVGGEYATGLLGLCHQAARLLLRGHPRRDSRNSLVVGIPQSTREAVAARSLHRAGDTHRLSADGRLCAGYHTADGPDGVEVRYRGGAERRGHPIAVLPFRLL